MNGYNQQAFDQAASGFNNRGLWTESKRSKEILTNTQVKNCYNLGVQAILWLFLGWSLNFTRFCMDFFIMSPQGGNLG
jgi:ammonia channel protein AmtB